MSDERSFSEVAAAVVHEAQRALYGHVALASAELGELRSVLVRGGVQFAVASVLGGVGLAAVAAAGVLALVASGLDAWAAALIVGLVLLGAATVIAWMAIAAIRQTAFLPHTVATFRGTAHAVQESVT